MSKQRADAKHLICPDVLIWFYGLLPLPPVTALPSGQAYNPSLNEMQFFTDLVDTQWQERKKHSGRETAALSNMLNSIKGIEKKALTGGI